MIVYSCVGVSYACVLCVFPDLRAAAVEGQQRQGAEEAREQHRGAELLEYQLSIIVIIIIIIIDIII